MTLPLRCHQCQRFYPKEEILAGICPLCWNKRSAHYNNGFNLGEYKRDENYRCFECKNPIIRCGYLHWVTDANSFGLFCVACSDKKYQKDIQFKDTPFAYKSGLQ